MKKILSEANVQYQKTLQQIWISIRHRPRGSDALLGIFALFRVLAVLGIMLRLDMFSADSAALSAPQPKEMVIILGLGYAVGLLLLFFLRPSIFYSQASKGLQIVFDVALYSLAYIMTGDSRSDIYFLNVMPLLIAVEYFPLSVVTVALAAILSLNLLFFTLLSEQRPLSEWLTRDYIPRMYVVVVIGMAYLVHRRLLPPAEGALADERESIIRQARTAAKSQSRSDIQRLDEQLRHFLESLEWSRRLLTRQAGLQFDDYALRLFTLMDEQGATAGNDTIGLDSTLGTTIDKLAQGLGCCAATFRLLDRKLDSKDVLVLVHAYCCAFVNEASIIKELPVASASMVAHAFRSGTIVRHPSVNGSPEPMRIRSTEFLKACDLQTAICVPIHLGDRQGVLALYRQSVEPFTEMDQHLILTVMDNLATMLASRIAVGVSTESASRLQRRLEIVSALAADFPSVRSERQLMERTVTNVRSRMRVEVASVFLRRGEHLRRKADAGIERDWFPDEAYRPDEGITGQAFNAKDPFKLVNDVKHSLLVRPDNLHKYSEKLATGSVHHMIVVPIEGQRDRIGVLRVINKLDQDGKIDPSGFTNDDAETLAILGSMLGTAIESTRQMEQINLLLAFAKEVTRHIGDITAVYSAICRCACAILNADQSGIVMCDPSDNTAVVEAQVRKRTDATGHTDYENQNVNTLPPVDLCESPLMKRLKTERRPIAVQDASSSELLRASRNLLREQEIESILILPLIIQDEIVGTLGIDSLRSRREFSEDEIQLAELVASIGAQGIEAAQTFSAAGRISRDAERKRVTDDLHDLSGLFGSTVIVDLQLMQDTAHRYGMSDVTDEIEATYTKAQHINDRLRRIMDDLVDPTLYDHGLAAALENFISKYSNRYRIELRTNVQRRLDEIVEHATYRIAQEAITNACSHGLTEKSDGQILVTLLESDMQLELCVKDNGCGFDESSRKPDRLGIYSMERRADELNGRGRLVIESSSGEGTTVFFCVQLTTGSEETEP